MILLAIDTSANLCSACVWHGSERELGRSVRDIGKGHAEVLMDVLGEALSAGGVGYGDLGAIAVSVGPGSFTGVRIGVATARGLALALKVPAIGVTTLEALAEEARALHPGRDILALVDAGRGAVYAAGYSAEGFEAIAPAEIAFERAVALVGETNPVLTGSAARAVAHAAGRPFDIAGEARTADIGTFARVALGRDLTDPAVRRQRPKPLYLRGADARPQGDFALARRTAP